MVDEDEDLALKGAGGPLREERKLSFVFLRVPSRLFNSPKRVIRLDRLGMNHCVLFL